MDYTEEIRKAIFDGEKPENPEEVFLWLKILIDEHHTMKSVNDLLGELIDRARKPEEKILEP